MTALNWSPPCLTRALGSLGCCALPTQTARDHIQEICRATNRPFSLNFFAHSAPRIDADAARRVRERLSAYYHEFDLGAVPEPSDPLPRFDEERLQLVLDLRPPVVSFHFGLPPADTLQRVKQTGAGGAFLIYRDEGGKLLGPPMRGGLDEPGGSRGGGDRFLRPVARYASIRRVPIEILAVSPATKVTKLV
jgi:hypothetical protein